MYFDFKRFSAFSDKKLGKVTLSVVSAPVGAKKSFERIPLGFNIPSEKIFSLEVMGNDEYFVAVLMYGVCEDFLFGISWKTVSKIMKKQKMNEDEEPFCESALGDELYNAFAEYIADTARLSRS